MKRYSALFVLMLTFLTVVSAKDWYHFTSSNSDLPVDEITSMAIDSKGAKWFIAENAGLVKMVDTTMTIYTPANSGIPTYTLYDVDVDSDDNVWIGTEFAGLIKFDGVNWTVYNTTNSDIIADMVWDFDFDSDGKIWIACNGGISILDTNGSFENIPSDTLNAVRSTVSAIEIDNNDDVWAFAGDLYHFDGSEWEHIGAPSYTAKDIHIDSSNVVWLCLYNYGAMRIDGDSLTSYNTGNSLIPHKSPYSAASYNNEIWFGTFNGIGILQDTSWTFMTPDNSPLVNKVVYDMELLDNGEKWFATRGGISAYFELTIEDTTGGDTTSYVNDLDDMKIGLVEAYPNPFNPSCNLSFNLPYDSKIELNIYSLTGEKISGLTNTYHHAGTYHYRFNASDLSSGVYIYRLSSQEEVISGKLLLMK